MEKATRWLVGIWQDVEPTVCGPYETDDDRTFYAREHRKKNTFEEGGIYRLTIGMDGVPRMDSFGGSELDAE